MSVISRKLFEYDYISLILHPDIAKNPILGY